MTIPPILAPKISNGDERLLQRTQFVEFKPWLTSYYFYDDSQYTIRVYDIRLRWSLRMNHEYATAKAEVWSRQHQQWNEVWTEIAQTTQSTYDLDHTLKRKTWQRVLDTLAGKVTTILHDHQEK